MSEDFEPLVKAARAGDESAFRALVEPLDRELHAYAYRMLGGFHDADDALQDSRLKAWRALASHSGTAPALRGGGLFAPALCGGGLFAPALRGGASFTPALRGGASFEPRASFRAWMYRIVTNTCLDLLKLRSRRVLPQDVSPSIAPGPPTTAPRADIAWIEPYPDALLPTVPSPEQAVRLREGIRLAFVRVVQLLPPRQRAALILHDVLEWSVVEVADMLETTEAAINSALQRARATIARPHAASSATSALAPRHAEVVERFVRAWESGDFDDFVALLATDAVMNMPPWEYWLDGKDAVVATMLSPGTWDGEPRPGRYKIVLAPMNGEPAGLAYVRAPDGRYHAVCLTALSLDKDGRIVELTTFVLPELFAAWGFPAVLDA
jgi:RNA polymerase sigma-70 factor (ECF subfamily)